MKILKKFLLILMGLIFVFAAVGCKQDLNDIESVDDMESITVKELIKKLSDQSNEENLNKFAFFDEEIFIDNCEKLYGISYEELSDGGIIFAGNGGFADEVTILRGRNGNVKELKSSLEERIQRRIKDFTGYKPSEISKIEKAEVFESGGFVILIISDNEEILKNQIQDIVYKNTGNE